MTGSTSTDESSRHKILVAAATMHGEDPTARLSVRAVAARAGVSTGSLRHHFPTQQALLDTVLAGIYTYLAPDDPIHDPTRPARDRLVACLRQILAFAGTEADAREAWSKVHATYIAEPPTKAARSNYLAMERQTRHRVEHWLAVLTDEGALTAGDNTRRAMFLLTVIDGMSVQRAMPAEGSRLTTETAALYDAVDAVLRTP